MSRSPRPRGAYEEWPVPVDANKRLSDWSEKYLSSSSKEVLIKSVIQALPTYSMSVFKFSKGLCDDLEQLTRKFWWGDEQNRRKIHWLSLDRMTHPKAKGGIGFRDRFIQALLVKQARGVFLTNRTASVAGSSNLGRGTCEKRNNQKRGTSGASGQIIL